MHLRLLGTMILGALVACGGGGASSPPPAEPEPASRCVTDASLAASRRAKPPEVGCMGDAWKQLGDACNEDDVDACYQIAICVKLQELGADMSAEERDKHQRAILTGLDKACSGGIAEACEIHVGARMMNQEPLPADGCDYLRRGCGLGDEQGCFACRYNGCE
jgi:hypothetical protein